MKTLFSIVAFFITFQIIAQQLDTLRYTVDGKPFMGFIARPDNITTATKTVLIVHEWWGLNEFPKKKAQQLARGGFIAICLDMYGEGIIVDNPKEAGELAGEVYANSKVLFTRFYAGYQAALKAKGVQKDKVAAIGFCFGGTVVLNVAKMGVDLDAIVSFHGGLQGLPLEKDRLKAAVLICNGEADKFVLEEEIQKLGNEMDVNGADYTFINYPEATHAFTNPFSTEVGKKFGIPIAYNEQADKDSYEDFLTFMKDKVK